MAHILDDRVNSMTVSTLSDSVYTDFRGLSQLQYKASTDNPQALQEVGKHFEALFIQMMLQSMRKATPDNPLFGDKAEQMYRDLFDKQISMSMAAKGQLGLADMIIKQLQHKAQIQDSLGKNTVQTPSAQTDNQASSSAEAVNKTAYASPSAFVKDVWPYAQKAGKQLNIDPQVLVAQAALETGWGRGVIKHPDGRSTHNLFGIKAGDGWQKDAASVPTLEYRDGVAVKERASFRSYGSLAEGFQDYVNFLQNNPRYKDALSNAADPQKFSNALQAAGYATDPNYAQKIGNVLGGDTLASAMADLKVNAPNPIG
jgi:flagellar protein FlgJ